MDPQDLLLGRCVRGRGGCRGGELGLEVTSGAPRAPELEQRIGTGETPAEDRVRSPESYWPFCPRASQEREQGGGVPLREVGDGHPQAITGTTELRPFLFSHHEPPDRPPHKQHRHRTAALLIVVA